ncbi:MAG: chromosome segregation protein SMC [Clostridiaceae bacterium]|nr:chromosome segregation protein SMC [Clostridiaceae bacterium]
MFLKALEIQGFKSFPERTLIEFHEGVTAIIGPNGSGKSNVTDAIRWVLGEQSVRTLRGSRMEDVIFTGTQSRRPMSFAEVTMIIDNTDQKLPLEYSEIQVTRRLYRSGESEYLLNKTSCRLKDIAQLFMDTGLGRDGYSIVGQGRVDDILSHRSEDRRRIFEEASGIVKFKMRKEEAERKLEGTEQNLLRINDIVQELESRLEPLSEQAAAAKRYLSLRDELKRLEVAQILDTIEQHQLKLQESEQEKTLLYADIAENNRRLVDIKNQNRLSTEHIHELDQTLDLKQQAFSQISAHIGELNSQISFHDERIVNLEQRINAAATEEQELAGSLGHLDTELAGRRKKAETLQKQQVHYRSQLADAEIDMQKILQDLDQAEKSVEGLKVRQDQLQEKLYDHRGLLTQTKNQTAMIENRRRTIEQDLRELQSDLNRLSFLNEEVQTELNRITREKQQTETQKQTLQTKLEQDRLACNQLSRQSEQDQQNLHNRQYRQQTLRELERSHEGYGEAVKRLLQYLEQNPAMNQGVQGTLGSLIRVGKDYECAIETALGPAIQNIVTDTEQTAARLIDYLKTSRAGRATFLPKASIRAKELEPHLIRQLANMPGYIGPASQLVQTTADLHEIVAFLLGRVIIAGTMDQAIQMARKIQYACRIVTLEGDVLNPGGSMTGGYNRQLNAGVLGRSREIEQLQQDIENLLQNIQNRSRQISEAETSLKEQARQIAELEQKSTEQSHLYIREEARQASFQQEQAKIAGRKQLLQAEDDQLKQQNGQIDQEISRLAGQIKDMEEESAGIKERIGEQEGANKEEQEKRDDLREQITELRVSLQSIDESWQAAQEMISRIEQDRSGQKNRIARHQREQADGRAEIARLQAERIAIIGQIETEKASGSSLAEEVSRIGAEKMRLESDQASFFDQLETATGQLSALQSEMSKIEAKASRFESLVDDAKNRLWEEYEMTSDQAQAWSQPPDNRAEAARRIGALKNELKTLGSVNLAAVEEFTAVDERWRFMVGQRDDIEASKDKLTGVIDELTAAMKKQFLEHFQLINDNFKTVFAELFGGGMAEINLEDEQDVLACGIEIKAQPPGKKLQNLMLLSGGERCLTAIALLFAILKLRPTPFCVLDEVEAALDDANVIRFTEYIRRYAAQSQFILVTHRKGTMEAADRLYGVTMQERGISRVLSMQLAE